MDYVGVVQLAHREDELPHVVVLWVGEMGTFGVSEVAVDHAVVEGAPAAVLVHQVDVVRGLEHLHESDEVGVAHLLENLD